MIDKNIFKYEIYDKSMRNWRYDSQYTCIREFLNNYIDSKYPTSKIECIYSDINFGCVMFLKYETPHYAIQIYAEDYQHDCEIYSLENLEKYVENELNKMKRCLTIDKLIDG